MEQTALPDSCQAYLNRTLQPTVPFTLGGKADRPQIWQSKVGGNPYLPLDTDYPRNANGEPLTLLAQVNFAEMPPLPHFPSSGLIQFFVGETDYSLGMDYDNYTNTANYRVVYYPEITQDLAQLCDDFTPFQAATKEEGALPVDGEYRIIFQDIIQQPISVGDFCNELVAGITNIKDPAQKQLWDALFEADQAEGHRIGGYPYFTQTDPREWFDHLKNHTVLLFQLDSDFDDSESYDRVLWGDSGVGNFFITPEDLRQRDFSRVLFTWDC